MRQLTLLSEQDSLTKIIFLWGVGELMNGKRVFTKQTQETNKLSTIPEQAPLHLPKILLHHYPLHLHHPIYSLADPS